MSNEKTTKAEKSSEIIDKALDEMHNEETEKAEKISEIIDKALDEVAKIESGVISMVNIALPWKRMITVTNLNNNKTTLKFMKFAANEFEDSHNLVATTDSRRGEKIKFS